MKIIRSSGIKGLMLAAALSIGLCFASPVSAQYGPLYSYLLDINSKTLTDLGALGSTGFRGINGAGQVVGTSRTAAGDWHAFITGPNGVGMTDLGTLGGNYSEALGINASGQVVGESQTASGAYHAFIAGTGGAGMKDLNSLVHVLGGVPDCQENCLSPLAIFTHDKICYHG